MKDKLVPLIIVALTIGAIGYAIYSTTTSAKPQPVQNQSETMKDSPQTQSPSPSTATETKMITLEEIAIHATKEDCWFAYEGKVYDVSKVAMSGKHPGGDAILLGCGKDATELFNTKGQKGEPHSDKARMNLESMMIGELAK